MFKRIKLYGKYAYKHLYRGEIKDFKLEYPYAYGTIDGFTYKVHVDKMIEGISHKYSKDMHDKDFFNNGEQSWCSVKWSDIMDLDNRFLLEGDIIDISLERDSVEYKLTQKILDSNKENLKELLEYSAYVFKDEKEKALNIGFEQGLEQGLYKGHKQGEVKGKRDKNIEITKKAIKKGLDNELISDLTGLEITKLEDLRKELEV